MCGFLEGAAQKSVEERRHRGYNRRIRDRRNHPSARKKSEKEGKHMSEIILRPTTVDDAAEMLAIYAPYVIQTTVSSNTMRDARGVYAPHPHVHRKAAVARVHYRRRGRRLRLCFSAPHPRGIPVVGGDLDLCRAGLAPPRHRRRDLRRAVRGARDAGLL